jgi:hypothetical protein
VAWTRPIQPPQQLRQSYHPRVWRWDATDIAAHIRLRTIASSDAVQSCLDRIAEVNPHLNAIVHMVANNALREAKEADAALKNNAPIGPLHGVPVTIKLNVDVKGEATTNGVVANRISSRPRIVRWWPIYARQVRSSSDVPTHRHSLTAGSPKILSMDGRSIRGTTMSRLAGQVEVPLYRLRRECVRSLTVRT